MTVFRGTTCLAASPLVNAIVILTGDSSRMIRLQTARRRDIPNNQLSEISAFERNYAADLVKRFADVRFIR